MRKAVVMVWCFIFVVLSITVAYSAEPAEQFLRNLPDSYTVINETVFSGEMIEPYSQRFGAALLSISNTVIASEGRRLQINVVTCTDEENAHKVYEAMSAGRPYPQVLLSGTYVIEFVDRNNAGVAFILRTAKHLGIIDSIPESAAYRISAELAAVDTADYMVLNPLMNQFLMLQGGLESAAEAIEELAANCTFGAAITLRNPALNNGQTVYLFDPAPSSSTSTDADVVYKFADIPKRNGVPYVNLQIEVTVDGNGFTADGNNPSENMISATAFWPVDDPDIRRLSQRITEGYTTADEKVAAILGWLEPGKNIKYEGQTGSRWGVRKVIEQQYGHCFDFSDLFITLARAAGVPCRQVGGWLYGSSGHVWAEYYHHGGWQQVDPTGGGSVSCGRYHVPYFTTSDGEMPILYLTMPVIEMVVADGSGGT